MEQPLLTTIIIALCIFGMLALFVLTALGIVLPTLGIVGGIGWFISKRARQARAMLAEAQSWPSTTGEVIKSRVQVSGGDHTSVSPYVLYDYQMGGMDFSGTQIRAGDQYYPSYTSTESYDVVDKYPVGSQVTVYYNPKDPTQAALER
jgi:hypothetical protein